ncbi:MAG: flippase [Patescibacteria group bacterium]|jgi:O-antigen/teichoic acid export membrane protein|nr:flippase [Patescibacteria group bacterium]
MSLGKKVAHNTLAQIIGKFLSTAIGLLSLAIMTRYLGTDGFGKYTTIVTFLSFFAVFADFGLTLITVQLISDKKRNEKKILNNLFAFRFVSIITLLAIAPLVSLLFPYGGDIRIGILIALLAFVFPALNQIIVGLLQKKLSMHKDAISENIGRIALLIGVILMKKFDYGLYGMLFVTSVAAGFNFLSHYIYSLKYAVIKFEWDFSLWKSIIKKSWPLALTIVLNLIYLKADTLVLSVFKSADEVGLYGATYRIIDVLTTIPFMFAGIILPIITAAWLEKRKDYFKKVLQKSLDFMIIAFIPLVIGTQFIAKEIMVMMAGSEFAQSGQILKILIFSLAAIFIGTMFSHAVIALDKQKKMIGFYVFTSITSLAAYLYFVPKYSYFGAASVTIYSEILIAIFSAYCVSKYSKFKLRWNTAFKSLLAGLTMAFVLYLINQNLAETILDKTTIIGLILTVLIAGIVYLLMLYLLGAVSKKDIDMIVKKQNKSGTQAFGRGQKN